MDSSDVEKRVRNLRKKLGQIEKLKEKDRSELDADARAKVDSETALLAEIAQLQGSGSVAEVQTKAAPKRSATPAEEKKQVTRQAKAPVPVAAAAEPEPSRAEADAPSPADAEKRIKAIKKKLQQIEKLKEKADALDADARDKVASEPELLREMACLQAGEAYVPPAPAPAASATAPVAAEVREDPHAAARAQALEPPPGDLGLLLDDETEKRFKAVQKKLRDIGKLHEKETLEKLQLEKLKQEPGLIEELVAIRAKAAETLDARRAAVIKAPKEVAAPRSQAPRAKNVPDWSCNSCGAFGSTSELIGGEGAAACPKCGDSHLTHHAPVADSDDDEEAAGAEEVSPSRRYESKDLKTGRQRRAAAAVRKLEDVTPPSVESAKWPEVKEILESGDRGVDKARQKKAIEVNQATAGAPYTVFDSVLLKCSFLTRMELKLPEGVLSSEAFQLYFPAMLGESLVELILKENGLTTVPPGINQLQRIRSIDLSHNKIEELPDAETWTSLTDTLELLDLSFNKLASIEQLAPLKKLSQLKVDANQLTSLDGVSWRDLKQLVTLSAVGNQLTSIPEAVGEFSVSLEYMEVSDNKLTTVPSCMSELKKLKSLNIAGNPIKDQKMVKAADKGVKDLKTYLAKIGGSKGKK